MFVDLGAIPSMKSELPAKFVWVLSSNTNFNPGAYNGSFWKLIRKYHPIRQWVKSLEVDIARCVLTNDDILAVDVQEFLYAEPRGFPSVGTAIASL